jgi:hypothetical protein
MNALAAAAKRHSRWLLCLALVFTLQLALIFWLSDTPPPPVRKSVPAPTLHLAGKSSYELLALSDPTLFALPHSQGFSGKAWIKSSLVPKRSFEWKEEPHWLTISRDEVPRAPKQETPTDGFQTLQMVTSLERETPPVSVSSTSRFRQKSELRLEGAIARQEVRNVPELPSWPYVENFTNTVIGVMVNPAGLVISPALLSRSGSKDADDYGLRLARQLQFKANTLAGTGTRGTSQSNFIWGELVFQWHVLPATNAPNQTGNASK